MSSGAAVAGSCRPVELAGRITNFSRHDPGELVARLEGPKVPRLSARCCGLGGDCGGGGGGDGVCVCVCNLVFDIPLYATQAGYDSGSAEGGGVFYIPFFPGTVPVRRPEHPDRPNRS